MRERITRGTPPKPGTVSDERPGLKAKVSLKSAATKVMNVNAAAKLMRRNRSKSPIPTAGRSKPATVSKPAATKKKKKDPKSALSFMDDMKDIKVFFKILWHFLALAFVSESLHTSWCPPLHTCQQNVAELEAERRAEGGGGSTKRGSFFGYSSKDDYGAGRATDNSAAKLNADIFSMSKVPSKKPTRSRSKSPQR